MSPSPLRPFRRAATTPRAELERLAFDSLVLRDFRAGLAPLGRLLLQLAHGDPERPIVLCCLAVAYAEVGRTRDAERVLRDAATTAATVRARDAVALAVEHSRRRA